MGLDIGFDIYKKKKEKDGKIVLEKAKIPEEHEYDAWACGRCDVNYAWGYGHTCNYFEKGPDVNPVFDKELDGYQFEPVKEGTIEYNPVKLKYIPYEEFKKNVMDAVEETEQNTFDTKKDLWNQIDEKTKTITELRELQKECTEDNEYAFEKWGEEIQQLKEDKAELKNMLDHYDEEDYDASHAKRIRAMIKYMEECQKDGYVCVPFYSD